MICINLYLIEHGSSVKNSNIHMERPEKVKTGKHPYQDMFICVTE